jgi:quaternary ammonium compound-resistance protein SugE
MAWLMVLLAGLLEVVWSLTMKLSSGFTRPGPTAITLAAMIASFALLSVAMRTLPLSVAYMTWTGIGAVGSFVVGTIALGEQLSAARAVAAALIVAGIVLMKLSSPG